MKRVLFKICLIMYALLAFGCAAKNGASEETKGAITPEVIELECYSAHQLGCSHKGRIYPWNAWVEVKGYNSKQYAVQKVIKNDNKATVLVSER